jgi:hypothetical protein
MFYDANKYGNKNSPLKCWKCKSSNGFAVPIYTNMPSGPVMLVSCDECNDWCGKPLRKIPINFMDRVIGGMQNEDVSRRTNTKNGKT